MKSADRKGFIHKPFTIDPKAYSDDQFESLALRTLRVYPAAARTCPWCLYDLGALLDKGATQPCPECGETVSGQINLIAWGKRARVVKLLKLVTLSWGVGFVLWAYTVPFLLGFLVVDGIASQTTNSIDHFLNPILMNSVPLLAAATPLVVFGCCYRWQYLLDPKRSVGTRLLISTCALIANAGLVTLGLWPYIMLYFFPLWP